MLRLIFSPIRINDTFILIKKGNYLLLHMSKYNRGAIHCCSNIHNINLYLVGLLLVFINKQHSSSTILINSIVSCFLIITPFIITYQ